MAFGNLRVGNAGSGPFRNKTYPRKHRIEPDCLQIFLDNDKSIIGYSDNRKGGRVEVIALLRGSREVKHRQEISMISRLPEELLPQEGPAPWVYSLCSCTGHFT